MNPPPLARALARALARDDGAAATPPADRDATIAEMARRLRARRLRRARAPWIALTAAAAAAALVAVGLRHGSSPPEMTAMRAAAPTPIVASDVAGSVLVVSSGHTTPVRDGVSLETGDHVLTLLDGGVTLALATGSRLALEGGGDVAILNHGATQLFELETGALRADVAKLAPGQRFVIRTSDAEVEVRGTSFRVATGAPDTRCGQSSKTQVHVFEGVVTVRTGQTAPAALHPGDSWPACPSEAPAPSAPPPPAVPASAPAPSSDPELAPPRPRGTSSDLAAENDLFDRAMSAKRRGDPAAAVAALDRLLGRYPACPFAESAALERMKLLASIDRSRAAEAAREYLRRYPAGFGRAEAAALAR